MVRVGGGDRSLDTRLRGVSSRILCSGHILFRSLILILMLGVIVRIMLLLMLAVSVSTISNCLLFVAIRMLFLPMGGIMFRQGRYGRDDILFSEVFEVCSGWSS